MERGLDANLPLDYVAFRTSPLQNRYEAFVCGQGRLETLSSGPLESLVVHLSASASFNSDKKGDNFKLQLPEALRGSSWFTKSTISRFLHIVGAPDLLKVASAIEDEMMQLEETRSFHLTLYAQGQQNHSGTGKTDRSYSNDVEPAMKNECQTASSDTTKNELLRAMDLRLTALRDELTAALNKATGATCTVEQITELAVFAEHFGAVDLRNCLSKYLSLTTQNQPADHITQMPSFSDDSKNDNGKMIEGMAQEDLPTDTVRHSKNGLSAAKLAQAERQSSTESDESSESSGEDQAVVERSRPLIRSASPRRSASPMRRIQIGRSGSRRSTALTIKSLSYFPARERISSNRDAADNSSEDEEPDQPQKKSENTVRRMSVQDAINLFESKQRDQKSDSQKWRSSLETSVSTNKAVLRRWSAGMSDSSTQGLPENSSEGSFHTVHGNSVAELVPENPVEVKPESDLLSGTPDPIRIAEPSESLEVDKKESLLTESPDLALPKAEEVPDRLTASAEWNRQKEAELNQMLMKMMESKPARYQSTTTPSSGKQDRSGERRGEFYDHYKERRDEKLRGENAGKRAEKRAQFKAMHEILDQRKAEMTSKSKNVGVARKPDSLIQSQKARRNSSPSVLSKREPSKPSVARKASPKASTLAATRSSWPSTPSPKSIGPPPIKVSSGTSSTGTTPNRRRPQPTPSPTRSSPKLERSQPQQKGIKGGPVEKKRNLKVQEGKPHKTVTNNVKSTKTKNLAASMDDSGTVPAKPSFYSKVTRKSSVVPLESKPFLRKGTGIGPGVGSVAVKSKASSHSDESSKNSGNLIQSQENDVIAATAETAAQLLPGDDGTQQPASGDVELEVLTNCNLNIENAENSENILAQADDNFTKTTEFPVQYSADEIRVDEDSAISSAAWVELDHRGMPLSSENGPLQITVPESVAPVSTSSPRVRHSLSQMLQADNGEPEIMEWGNAENPPAMVYQKDSPKGLKRLLKFARKSKGDANVTGWASPSVFSEGEEDADEPKAASKKNVDALVRKSALQAKGFGQQSTMFGESYDGGNSSKREYTAGHELVSGQSNASNFTNQVSHKLREGQNPATAASTKAARSFFSLSNFRSSKSSEAKLR